MKWSILILTQPSRTLFLKRLKERLEPQLVPQIEVIEHISEQGKTYGQNCEALRQKASGEYINFVDDDDLVAEDYVSSIFPLLDGADYIGFQVAYFSDGIFQTNVIHSLSCKTWCQDNEGIYRDLSHLNPMRRELALQIPMTKTDAMWAAGIRELGIVKTQHYIPRPMYLYYFRSQKSDGCNYG